MSYDCCIELVMWRNMQSKLTTIPKITKRLAIVGTGLLFANASLLAIGLFAISAIEDEVVRTQLSAPYLVIYVLFAIAQVTMIWILHQGLLASRTEEDQSQQAIQTQERAINQLQVAAQIARDATAQENLQGLLDHAVQLICERFDFYHAGIFLIDTETNYAVIRAAYGGAPTQQMLEQKHQLKVGEEGIVGFVTSTGQPRVVLDTDADSYHYKNPVLPETRSELTLPFRVGNQIIGALDVQSTKRGAFDQGDINILQTLADLLAVAINKANLNEMVWAYADELETRVKARTQELESERAQLQVILDSMGDGLMYDEELDIIYTNKALTDLTGFERADWKDGLLAQVKPLDMSDEELKEIQQELYRAVGHKGIWKKELKLTRLDGTSFDASIVCTAVQRDPETNHAKGAVTIIRDISQQKALDEQKSRFIANAAHELRTPLANVKTRLYLLRHQPQKFDEHYDILKSVTGRMQRLIDDLLDMSRFERNKIRLTKEPTQLQHLIHDVVKTQRPEAATKNLDLVTNLTSDVLYAEIDRDRMIQVLTNLISNAINYTESGTITVHLRKLPDHQIEICVEDTGVGIKPDMIEKIFQPFVRVNHDTTKGTGLGLNISREIVLLHGGDLRVESEFGNGSRFIITLEHVGDRMASVS